MKSLEGVTNEAIQNAIENNNEIIDNLNEVEETLVIQIAEVREESEESIMNEQTDKMNEMVRRRQSAESTIIELKI